MNEERLEGLRQALALSPENHALRLVYAEALGEAGDAGPAADEYETLRGVGALPPESLHGAARAALDAGRLDLAGGFLAAAREAGIVEGTAALQHELDERLGLAGVVRLVRRGPDDGEDGIALELDAEERVTFADVGGLDEVKKTIHRTIVLPFQRPELYERYGRRAGGGVLLFGPPGCGKTMLARATAGECGLPFSNVRIEEILDPMFGISERNLHDAFLQARHAAPCVLFLDELDAIGFARRKHSGSAGRPLVDQLLQELDAIGSDNRELLVLAATNAPWDVDEALKRPGRFDRVLFVPPPDEEARTRILELHLSGRPTEGLDLARLARRTPLFSGADLRALVERATDLVIDEALETGGDPPLATTHVEAALKGMRPSTLEWLATARNYVEFANQGGRYDEVSRFLLSPEARSWRD
ncbi:MAG TPA: AAA family ATPase [Gaiellaceae bacterium]|jgi:AAA+ superfamily predicted ATPase